MSGKNLTFKLVMDEDIKDYVSNTKQAQEVMLGIFEYINMLQDSRIKLFQEASMETVLNLDSNGNPIQFLIHDGTTHDVKVAPGLVDKIDLTDTDVLSAEKGYDSKALREQIERTSTKAKIPKKSNTLSNNHYMDWHLYKIRHLVENTFARIKQFRGIATRYDKLKQNYENSVALACIFIWLPL